jgi:hypothetical protein
MKWGQKVLEGKIDRGNLFFVRVMIDSHEPDIRPQTEDFKKTPDQTSDFRLFEI